MFCKSKTYTNIHYTLNNKHTLNFCILKFQPSNVFVFMLKTCFAVLCLWSICFVFVLLRRVLLCVERNLACHQLGQKQFARNFMKHLVFHMFLYLFTCFFICSTSFQFSFYMFQRCYMFFYMFLHIFTLFLHFFTMFYMF